MLIPISLRAFKGEHPIQLHQDSSDAANESNDGGRRHGSALGRLRPRSALGVLRAGGGKGGCLIAAVAFPLSRNRLWNSDSSGVLSRNLRASTKNYSDRCPSHLCAIFVGGLFCIQETVKDKFKVAHYPLFVDTDISIKLQENHAELRP
jgi:hypothetical protein